MDKLPSLKDLERKDGSGGLPSLSELPRKSDKPTPVLNDIPLKSQRESDESKFGYGFAKTGSFTTNLGDYLERHMPAGRIQFYTPGRGFHLPEYFTPEEVYGENQSPEAIKRVQEAIKDEYLGARFPELHARPESEKGGFAEGAGAFAAVMVDPTSLAPIGRTVKAAAAIGGLIGAADMAAYGLAEDDKVDPTMVALGATGGAVLGGTFVYLGGKLSRMMQKSKIEDANRLMDTFEDTYKHHMQTGQVQSPGEAIDLTMKQLNLNEDALIGLGLRTGRKLKLAHKDPEIDAHQIALNAALERSGVDKQWSGFSEWLDDYIGVASTRIRDIAPEVGDLLRRTDAEESVMTHEAIEAVNPFLANMKKLSRKDQKALDLALGNRDSGAIKRIIKKVPGMENNYEPVRKVLDDIYNGLKSVGYDDITYLKNYWPRVIKDPQKLMSKLPTKMQEAIKKDMRPSMTVEEKGDVINKYIRGVMSRENSIDHVFGATKERQIKTISEAILDAYASPAEALHSYIRRSIHDIHRRKFFGRGAKNNEFGNLDIENSVLATLDSTDNSVGAALARQQEYAPLSPEKMEKLKEILIARFGVGERSPSGVVQNTKNILYMSTIANPWSALTQLGDIGTGAFAHGVRNAVASIFGKKFIDAAQLGITDISQEFASTKATAKALDSLLWLAQFKRIDMLGKNVAINAAYRKSRRQLGTIQKPNAKGVYEFRKKWGLMFGDETEALIKDIQTGNHSSRNIKLMLFSELADLQPISPSETPLKYLQVPDGRLLYMLKTFMIKQLDVMRRNIWHEARSGSKKKAALQAARYVALFNMANVGVEETKRWMLTGETPTTEDLPDKVVWSIMKNFGGSEYLLNKFGSRGEIGSLLANIAAPPFGVVDGIFGMFMGKEGFEDNVKYMPLFGKFLYYWKYDGVEKMLEREQKKEMQEYFPEMDEFNDLGL